MVNNTILNLDKILDDAEIEPGNREKVAAYTKKFLNEEWSELESMIMAQTYEDGTLRKPW